MENQIFYSTTLILWLVFLTLTLNGSFMVYINSVDEIDQSPFDWNYGKLISSILFIISLFEILYLCWTYSWWYGFLLLGMLFVGNLLKDIHYKFHPSIRQIILILNLLLIIISLTIISINIFKQLI